VTKKEIVKQISDEIGLTQLKTKEIVQKTFNAIVETLLRERRIELRNFGVFEVKRRKARKARNPRTGERVEVEPKNVVTFKPGKEMEEKVRNLELLPETVPAEERVTTQGNGADEHAEGVPRPKIHRPRKSPSTRSLEA
jgi:nucleoid DNA-binding protein